MGMINVEYCVMVSLRTAKQCGQEDVIIYKANLISLVLFLNQRGRYTEVHCMY